MAGNFDHEAMRRIRRAKRMTQKKLAPMCGVSASHINQIERGAGNPSPETAQRIAAALGVPVDELLHLPTNDPVATEEERELIAAFRMLPEPVRLAALAYLVVLARTGNVQHAEEMWQIVRQASERHTAETGSPEKRQAPPRHG